MSTLGEVARIRSKNAGPFWITVDIFSPDAQSHASLRRRLSAEAVARLMHLPPEGIRRFEIEGLHVIKLSFARPSVQGAIDDRDMHGAACASLLAGLSLDKERDDERDDERAQGA